jgi:hypothetical protein
MPFENDDDVVARKDQRELAKFMRWEYPEHNTESNECWCDPEIMEGVVIHRGFSS